MEQKDVRRIRVEFVDGQERKFLQASLRWMPELGMLEIEHRMVLMGIDAGPAKTLIQHSQIRSIEEW
jgi:hypothetical protein